jgi:hypothetical protein
VIAPIKRDWPRICREIIAGYGLRHKRKLTPYKLGLMAGADKKTVRRWINGTSKPNHEQGEMLLARHAEFHRETGDTVPTTIGQPLMSAA